MFTVQCSRLLKVPQQRTHSWPSITAEFAQLKKTALSGQARGFRAENQDVDWIGIMGTQRNHWEGSESTLLQNWRSGWRGSTCALTIALRDPDPTVYCCTWWCFSKHLQSCMLEQDASAAKKICDEISCPKWLYLSPKHLLARVRWCQFSQTIEWKLGTELDWGCSDG